MTVESGWVYDPVPKHFCIIPTQQDLTGHFEGAIWKCGDCGLHWEVWWDVQDRKKDMRTISPSEVEQRLSEHAA